MECSRTAAAADVLRMVQAVRHGGAVVVPAPRSGAFRRCTAATTFEQACQGLAEDLHETWELPSVYLLVDGRLRCQAARGYFQVVDGFTPDAGIIGRVVSTGRPAVVHDVRSDPAFLAAIPGVVAEASVPVRVHGAVVGAVSVESRTGLPPDVVQQLTAAAVALGRSIERVGGMPPVPFAERLARIAVGLTGVRDPVDLRLRALEGACETSGMSSAALGEVGDDSTWSVTAATGPLAPSLSTWSDADLREMAGWVHAGTSSHFPGGLDVPPGYEFLLRTGVRALAVHPLVATGRVLGLIIAADDGLAPHDAAIGTALELLAAQTAALLANAQALAELSRRAEEDPLTGLRNAAAFTRDLAVAAPGAVCLLIDVDHFKQVNDTFGHVAGDRLLCALADELRARLREPGHVYRVGGDELAVLLEPGGGDAEGVAQRLVEAARRVRTTVSIGLASIGGGPPELARLRADVALYAAKSQGRDRYAFSGEGARS